MGALPAVVAANAHRWMVEAVFESTAVRITFANGDRFRFPLVRLGAPGSLQVARASIAPDGMSLEIPVARGDEKVEVPWDLVRAECDPDFGDRVRASEDATAASVGRKIAEVRRLASLSQDALARRARIARATVNRIERGRLLPEVSTLRRIARALGMSLPDLVIAGPIRRSSTRRRRA
jgi:DNA-binding XRE family transcriptional regulator